MRQGRQGRTDGEAGRHGHRQGTRAETRGRNRNRGRGRGIGAPTIIKWLCFTRASELASCLVRVGEWVRVVVVVVVVEGYRPFKVGSRVAGWRPRTHTHTRAHTRTNAHTRANERTRTHTTHKRAHTQTQRQTNKQTHTQTHTRTCTRTPTQRTNAHTQTYTHLVNVVDVEEAHFEEVVSLGLLIPAASHLHT